MPAQIDRIEGHELHITNPDKTLTFAAIHLHARRLYILEATVPRGSGAPLEFQNSLSILDEDGNTSAMKSTRTDNVPAA